MASESPDSIGLGLDEPPQPAKALPYRVLARKYRPQSFDELIGQDAMVRTLGNAIQRDRLAHAFLLTGVRGVGKRSEEHTSELQSLMRISYAVFCLKKKKQHNVTPHVAH